MTIQPHIQLQKKDISPYVLLPGDPARVDTIGQYLKNFAIVSNNREYRCGIGYYKEKKITVCSTGIGCPSTAIAVEELIAIGAKYLIRVGTCGGTWREDIEIGSLIIPTASIRDEGTTIEYIPQGFPAIADREIVNALIEAAEKLQSTYSVGINRTHDAFYGSQQTIRTWGSYLTEDRWKYENTPILSSEMESSALFIISTLRNVQAGAIFAVNAHPEPLKDRISGKNIDVVAQSDKEVSKKTIDHMIRVALEAMVKLP